MAVFEVIKLQWGDQSYTVAPDRVLGLIAMIEDVVTIPELHEMISTPRRMKLSKVARAYGEALRYAGAEISDEEVYGGMFGGGARASAGVVQTALVNLLGMMIPESVVEKDSPAKKSKPAARSSSAKRSS